MKEIKEGSRWSGNDGNAFRVLHVIEKEGHTWVHYIKEVGKRHEHEPQEYSCYVESFISRFRELPE